MMDAPDKGTSARRAWIQQEARRQEYRRKSRRIWLAMGSICVLWMALIVALSVVGMRAVHAGECDGFHAEVGIGVHAKSWDAPDYTTPNPLGMVELSYKYGRARWVLSHTSSLQGFPAVWDSPDEYGYGANVASMRWALW